MDSIVKMPNNRENFALIFVEKYLKHQNNYQYTSKNAVLDNAFILPKTY